MKSNYLWGLYTRAGETLYEGAQRNPNFTGYAIAQLLFNAKGNKNYITIRFSASRFCLFPRSDLLGN